MFTDSKLEKAPSFRQTDQSEWRSKVLQNKAIEKGAFRQRIVDSLSRLLSIRSRRSVNERIVSWTVKVALMSSTMQVPAPPREPTPPPDQSSPSSGLGLDSIPYATTSEILYDPNSLSPADPNARFGSMSANMASPANSNSVYSSLSLDTGKSDASSPFNFQTTTLAKSPVVKSVRCSPAVLINHSAIDQDRPNL